MTTIFARITILIVFFFVNLSLAYRSCVTYDQPALLLNGDRYGRNERMELFMVAKKKKAKKAEESINGKDSLINAAKAQTPQRVTNRINIPVRQQIAWAKAYKRLMAAQSAPQKIKERFKKEKTPKEIEEEYVEVDYVKTKPPAIFVDGYNVIGYINQEEGRSIELSDARDCLISDLCVLSTATGWWIEAIFDAYKVMGPEKRESVDNILVTYTSSSETADNHIERRFEELRQEGFNNMVVATDDNVLRMVAGSSGAGYISCSMLLEELRVAYRGWEMAQEESHKESKKHRPKIGDGVSDDIKNAIAMLKQRAAEKRNAGT